MEPPLDGLQVVYGSDIFLEDKRLRAAMALLYDRVHLAAFPGVNPCSGEHRSYIRVRDYAFHADGMLGVEGVIVRGPVPDSGMQELEAPEPERVGTVMYIPDVFRALADEEGTLAGEEPFRSRFGGSRAEYERWRHFLI